MIDFQYTTFKNDMLLLLPDSLSKICKTLSRLNLYRLFTPQQFYMHDWFRSCNGVSKMCIWKNRLRHIVYGSNLCIVFAELYCVRPPMKMKECQGTKLLI